MFINKYPATRADIARLKQLYKGRIAMHGELHDHSGSGDPENDPWKTADGKYSLDMWPNFLLEKDLDFVALWIANSRKLGMTFYKHQARSISMQADGVEYDAAMTLRTISYEVDLLSPISGTMRKIVELKMQDVSEACIAKELGLAHNSVGQLYGRAKKILRQYWSRDKELCKIFQR
jgi:hypothetical protein